MAIFGVIQCESVVQTNDKTRISAARSFVSKDSPSITKVRIRPEASGDFIEVGNAQGCSDDWFLDWAYVTAGAKTITLEITAGSVQTFTQSITVVLPADDKLLSSDTDLRLYEPDILNWLPAGRNSYNDMHRSSLNLILDWMDSIRLWKNDGTKITKDDLGTTEDLKQLSIYWTLSNIFKSISTKNDDVFAKKASEYESLALSVKGRGRIQADFNSDGQVDEADGQDDGRSYFMVRR